MRTNKIGWLGLAVLALSACTTPDLIVNHGPKLPIVVAEQPPAPELVSLELAPVDRLVQAGQSSTLDVRVRIAVAGIPGSGRTPANLALAIDTSGSMEGKSIDDARDACLAALDALADGDRVAIVTFDSQARIIVPSTVLDAATRAEAKKLLSQMRASGTTNMAAGLGAALGEVRAHLDADHVNRLVLVGDGVPNDASALAAMARQAGADGIGITALGLGLDYDETLMASLAKESGGKFRFVRDSANVAAFLEKEVLRLQRTVGRGAVLQLVTGPGVRVEEVVGHDLAPASGGVVVPLGDLAEEERRDVIVRVTVPARAAGSSVEIIDATVRYDDALVGGGSVEEQAFLGVHATADKSELAAGHDAEVERSAARVSVASLVLRAIAYARSGQLPTAYATLDRAEKLARERARALDDAEIAARAGEMAALRASLPTLVPIPIVAEGPAGPDPGAAPTAMREPRPAEAAAVRGAHDAAMQTIQGD